MYNVRESKHRKYPACENNGDGDDISMSRLPVDSSPNPVDAYL